MMKISEMVREVLRGKAPYTKTMTARFAEEQGPEGNVMGFVKDIQAINPDSIFKVFYDETEKLPWVVYEYEKRES